MITARSVIIKEKVISVVIYVKIIIQQKKCFIVKNVKRSIKLKQILFIAIDANHVIIISVRNYVNNAKSVVLNNSNIFAMNVMYAKT